MSFDGTWDNTPMYDKINIVSRRWSPTNHCYRYRMHARFHFTRELPVHVYGSSLLLLEHDSHRWCQQIIDEPLLCPLTGHPVDWRRRFRGRMIKCSATTRTLIKTTSRDDDWTVGKTFILYSVCSVGKFRFNRSMKESYFKHRKKIKKALD